MWCDALFHSSAACQPLVQTVKSCTTLSIVYQVMKNIAHYGRGTFGWMIRLLRVLVISYTTICISAQHFCQEQRGQQLIRKNPLFWKTPRWQFPCLSNVKSMSSLYF